MYGYAKQKNFLVWSSSKTVFSKTDHRIRLPGARNHTAKISRVGGAVSLSRPLLLDHASPRHQGPARTCLPAPAMDVGGQPAAFRRPPGPKR